MASLDQKLVAFNGQKTQVSYKSKHGVFAFACIMTVTFQYTSFSLQVSMVVPPRACLATCRAGCLRMGRALRWDTKEGLPWA